MDLVFNMRERKPLSIGNKRLSQLDTVPTRCPPNRRVNVWFDQSLTSPMCVNGFACELLFSEQKPVGVKGGNWLEGWLYLSDSYVGLLN